MPQAQQYFARGGFGYGPVAMLDTGQVIELRGERNDEKLLRLGHLRPVLSGQKPVQCGKCGSFFVDDASLNQHGRRRHSRLDPEAEDKLDEEEDRKRDERLPIQTEKAKGRR